MSWKNIFPESCGGGRARLNKILSAIGARLPDPNILPPSLLEFSTAGSLVATQMEDEKIRKLFLLNHARFHSLWHCRSTRICHVSYNPFIANGDLMPNGLL